MASLPEKKILIPLILVTVVVLDQITKYLAAGLIDPSSQVEILPVLHLVNVKNTGAAFGMLKSLGNNFFIAVSVLAIALIAVLLVKSKEGLPSLCLILAGAMGNLIDRLFLGYVRDFLDFSIGKYHWPAFNVADSAITIGLLTMILIGTVFRKKS